MCMAVYIASDSPLPLIAWNQRQPGFHVTELQGDVDERVRCQFSKPLIYYVGAHTGCGCGFEYGNYPEYEDDDIEKCRQSVAQLSAYLAQATAQNGPIELFSCWEDDQDKTPEKRDVITPADIGGESFCFDEKQFLLVRPTSLPPVSRNSSLK